MRSNKKSLTLVEAIAVLSCYARFSTNNLTDEEGILAEAELEYALHSLFFQECENISHESINTVFLKELIKESKEAYTYYEKSCLEKLKDRYSKNESSAILKARLDMVSYRNTIYFDNLIEITNGIFLPISDEIKRHTNIDFELLLKLFNYLVKSYISKGIELQFRTRSGGKIYGFFDDITEEQNLNEIRRHYLIPIKNLAYVLGRTEEKIRELIELIGYKAGEKIYLEDSNDFFEELPLRYKPFLIIDENHIMLPSETLLSTYFFDMAYSLIKNNKSAMESYSRKKGEYLENKIASLFLSKCTKSEVYRSFMLSSKESNNENDVLVKYGDTLFVIEAKSNKIHHSIFKGRLDKLKQNLSETILKGDKQASRLVDELNSSELSRVGTIKNKPNIKVVLNPNRLINIKKIVVILHEFGGLHTNYRNYKPIISDVDPDTMVFTLNDLMLIFELFDTASEVMDYLFQRKKFEKAVNFIGDEVDLLGYYLINRLDVDYKKYKNCLVKMQRVSISIDDYKNNKLWGVNSEKPKCEITPFWNCLIRSLEGRLGGESRDITSELFRVNITSQQEIIECLCRMSKNVQKNFSLYYYDTASIKVVSSGTIVQFVLIKHSSLNTFPEILSIVNNSQSVTHFIFLNVLDNLNYSGYLKKRKSIKEGRGDKEVIIL